MANSLFGVDFRSGVDAYRHAERAIKYGVLFIALVFAAFFLFEILAALRIHPLQYTLVGGALYSLLVGTAGLFLVLAVVFIITRVFWISFPRLLVDLPAPEAGASFSSKLFQVSTVKQAKSAWAQWMMRRIGSTAAGKAIRRRSGPWWNVINA